MKRPIMHTASAPACDAASANAGRLADSRLSFTHTPCRRSPHARGRRVGEPVGSVSCTIAPVASEACGAPTFNSNTPSRARRRGGDLHRAHRHGKYEAGGDETALARGVAVDRGNRREPVRRIACASRSGRRSKHRAASGCAMCRAARSPRGPTGGAVGAFVDRFGDHAGRPAASAARIPIRHHRFAGPADDGFGRSARRCASQTVHAWPTSQRDRRRAAEAKEIECTSKQGCVPPDTLTLAAHASRPLPLSREVVDAAVYLHQISGVNSQSAACTSLPLAPAGRAGDDTDTTGCARAN